MISGEKVRGPSGRAPGGQAALGPEWKNYLGANFHRGGSVAGLTWALRAVSRRLARRGAKKRILPDYLSSGDLELEAAGASGVRLPLGAESGELAAPAGAADWARKYAGLYQAWLRGSPPPSPDPEVYWTLHQFGWLLALALLRSPEAGPAGVRDAIGRWMARMGRATGDLSWRSFSISERLCNWYRLFGILGLEAMPGGASASMADQASHLAGHLECFSDGSTNNHLLNNGRALYLCGAYLRRDDLLSVGRQVLVNEAGRQFTEEGFLDEGSSHYHLIFTRAYLDALQVASSIADRETLDALRAPVSRMLAACAYFADEEAPPEWMMPFLGDISPDPPPAFFDRGMRFWEMARLAASGQDVDPASAWFAAAGPGARTGGSPGWSCHPRSGHYRFSNERYRIWWHSRRKGVLRRHSHNDWGSFQLHVGGEPLFIDPGRYSYSAEVGSFDHRLTLAQNAAAVDGLEQALFRRRELFMPEYLDDGAEVSWGVPGDGETPTIAFEIHGYRRLRHPLTHTRLFQLEPEKIRVSDRFKGTGRHQVLLAFHLHPAVGCSREGDAGFILTTPGGLRVRFSLETGGTIWTKRGGDPRTPGGYSSNAYGTRHETTTIFAEFELEPGLLLESKIEL